MEAHLVQTLKNDVTLQTILTGGIFATSALGIGPYSPDPEKPYLVWKELPSTEYDAVSETSNVELRVFQFFVYDNKGDFDRINTALRRVKQIVKEIAPFALEDGTRCSGASWGGMSGTLIDDGYDSAIRYGIARFTVSQPV